MSRASQHCESLVATPQRTTPVMLGVLRVLRATALAILNYLWLWYYPAVLTGAPAPVDEEQPGNEIIQSTSSSSASSCTNEKIVSSSTSTTISSGNNFEVRATTAAPKPGKIGKGQFFTELASVTAADFVTLDGLFFALPYEYYRRYRYHPEWAGRSLFDVFTQDRDFTVLGGRAYWEREVSSGRVVTRSGKVSNDFIWQEGLSIWHQQHFHEPPIACGHGLPSRGLGIEMISVTEKHVVVSKPPSMAIHPNGLHKRTTLVFLVAMLYGYRTLHVVHRLDKPVSGVVIFARSREAAAELHKIHRRRQLRKIYIAQVVGDFKHDKAICEMPLGFDAGRAIIDRNKGKDARTVFTKIRYNPNSRTTLIECRPTTGRRHQIRVHLQWLGFPIVDDPLYGSGPPPRSPDPTYNLHHLEVPRGPKILEVGRELRCPHCPYLFVSNVPVHRTPIRLHAWKYEDSEFSYVAKPPAWAQL